MLVAVNDGQVEVRVRGSGDLVVLVPSLGRGGGDFDALAGDLEEAGYRAAAMSPRGIDGGSPAVPGLGLHDFAADVACVVEALADGPVHLVGHAFGNRIVRCLASDRPDLARSVTLVAAGGQVPSDPETHAALMRIFELDRPDEERLADIQHAFFAPGHDPSVWLDGWYPATKEMQWSVRDRIPFDEWGRAGTAPVLVIQGLDDPLSVPANGYALRDRLGADRVRVVDVPNASHAMLPEQPAVIARELLAFLREQSG